MYMAKLQMSEPFVVYCVLMGRVQRGRDVEGTPKEDMESALEAAEAVYK
jgi:hypothetical protein